MNKIEKKFRNLQSALNKLKQFQEEYSGREIEQAGVIQAFEFTYEVFWQFFKVCASESGQTQILGPRDAFKFAFSSGFIESDSEWLSMIPQRNDTVHSYNDEVSERVFNNVNLKFVQAFSKAEKAIASHFGF